MSECGCHAQARTDDQHKVLRVAIGLNAAMAVVGGVAGWLAESAGLLADALDMLSDASAYAIGLAAVARSARFKANAAMASGCMLVLLGVGVLSEVARRAAFGADPQSAWMFGTSLLSLTVNLTVLRLLAPFKSGEVHLRATWQFTRADVVANLAVIVAGVLVLALASPYPDLVIGTLIGLYVIKEALGILREASSTRRNTQAR